MPFTRFFAIALFAFLASGFKPAAKSGIEFIKGDFSQALEMASAQDKYVFVYVFASWCGTCKQLKRSSFKDKEVGDYFNRNFINVAVNGESGEGLALLRAYGITSYPTLLITDKNAKKMTKTTGLLKPRILINFGRRIVP